MESCRALRPNMANGPHCVACFCAQKFTSSTYSRSQITKQNKNQPNKLPKKQQMKPSLKCDPVPWAASCRFCLFSSDFYHLRLAVIRTQKSPENHITTQLFFIRHWFCHRVPFYINFYFLCQTNVYKQPGAPIVSSSLFRPFAPRATIAIILHF